MARHRADGGEVVDGEDRARPGIAVEQALRRLVAAAGVGRGSHHHEVRVDRDTGRGQGVRVALRRSRAVETSWRLGDVGDAPMAETEQVIDQAPRPADAVALHQIAFDTGDRAIDQHEGGRMRVPTGAGCAATGR